MHNIKVLDCTLRDGGYVNNWSFGQENAQKIIFGLQKAKLDFIEIGFIGKKEANSAQTLFNDFEKINAFLPKNYNKNSLLAMIAYGTFPLEKIPKIEASSIGGIRVIFKKDKKEEALKYCQKIKEKGYKLFINPTYVDQYDDNEFLNLIKDVSNIEPYAFSIVDSLGVMKENDILRLYFLIEQNLKKEIALCFHSHNNLQLSFLNAQCLMKNCLNRELIIDSTIFGMGRGAGNLRSEFLAQYINNNFMGEYDIVPILKIVDEEINPIFKKTPWGYSVPYHLAAVNHCHPNYAKFLSEKKLSTEKIDNLLASIPKEKKITYDKDFIQQLFLNNFWCCIIKKQKRSLWIYLKKHIAEFFNSVSK